MASTMMGTLSFGDGESIGLPSCEKCKGGGWKKCACANFFCTPPPPRVPPKKKLAPHVGIFFRQEEFFLLYAT